MHCWALAGFGRPVQQTYTLSPGLRQDAGWELPSHHCPSSQDVVNCVGGMGALLPLLERVAVQPQEAEAGPCETHDLVGPELTSGHNTQGLLLPLGKSSGECPSHLQLGESVLVWWGDCARGSSSWHTLDQPLPSSWWSAEERMERNAVAAFLLMLRNFLQGHTANQESLVQCQGPAILGALLRKVRRDGGDRAEPSPRGCLSGA